MKNKSPHVKKEGVGMFAVKLIDDISDDLITFVQHHQLKAAFFLAAVLGTVGSLTYKDNCCTDPEGAQKMLKNAGYTSPKIGGYAWFASDRTFNTQFEATDKEGKRVKGFVSRNQSGPSSIGIYEPD